ncbi:MAG TPA: EVE domain-containing protein [Symbiobacteriaceae bacterium]|jgi:predicted RNA-binding protein with PUA-like domain|nr:EVE domain-containing protein [Symbiobacteriaceae bacterium]
MAYWLMKTEPDEFSYTNLEERGREPWNGVKNPTALKHMRAMVEGDLFLFYHTGDQRAVVGVGRITKAAYPDPQESDPKWVVVDVVPAYRFAQPVTLAAIKADAQFAQWELVRQSRLSVMPVSPEHWLAIHAMGATLVSA